MKGVWERIRSNWTCLCVLQILLSMYGYGRCVTILAEQLVTVVLVVRNYCNVLRVNLIHKNLTQNYSTAYVDLIWLRWISCWLVFCLYFSKQPRDTDPPCDSASLIRCSLSDSGADRLAAQFSFEEKAHVSHVFQYVSYSING